MMSFSFLAIFILFAVVFVVFAYTAILNRRHTSMSDRKPCKHCQAVWPVSAKYCGKCGRSI